MNAPLNPTIQHNVSAQVNPKAAPFADPQDNIRNQAIRKAILEAGNQLRSDYPWLVTHQNKIGMGIMLTAASGIMFNLVQYARGKMPWYVAVPLSAFWMSILHELEHDLIHLMYYRKDRRMNDLMLGVVYAFRLSTINPWIRRDLHLHHHKSSGTESDVEERGITNGEKWGLKRLLMTGDNLLAVYLRPVKTYKMNKKFLAVQKNLSSAEKHKLHQRIRLGYMPFGAVHYTLWHGFWALSATKIGLKMVGLPKPKNRIWRFVDRTTSFYAATLAAPNALRTFCLHFVSSNMHYYGDVEDNNPVQQCQVWTDKRLAPLHAFCFNFGATHAIHHFVVRDPFYIRQAIAHKCYPTMRENGVRFNDFGTFKRANRRSAETKIVD